MHTELERLESRVLLAGDLIAHWRANDLLEAAADGETVSVWTDSVAGIEARAVGSPVVNANALGGRGLVSFDPADDADAFQVANGPLAEAEDFSVAFLFQTDSNSLQGEQGSWFTNTGLVDSNQLGLGNDWGITINAAGSVSAGMTGGLGSAVTSIYSSQAALNDGQPHTVVFTRSGGQIDLYIDGQLSASRADASAAARGDAGLTIGALQTGANYFTGQIGEVRLYNGQLSAAEATTVSDEISAFYSNSAPVAADDRYVADEDALLFLIPASEGVLANDVDADGDPLTVELVTGTRNGTVSLNADGSFVYDSATNFFGTDQFTYRVSDFRPGNEATVTIDVQPVYDRPVAVDDVYSIRPGTTLTVFSLIGILANDENPDRADLSAVLAEDVGNGQLSLQSNGGLTYDPQGFSGRTSFRYQIDDGTGLSAPATVRIAVTSPPVAQPDVFQTNEDTPLVLSGGEGILANDVDAENDALTVSLIDDVTNGVLELGADGALRYTPVENYHGPDSFSYQINDGFDASETVTVTIDVVSVNDPPVAEEDGYFLLPNRTLAVTADQGVLNNDFDLEGGEFTAALATPPANGNVEFQADGSFVYVPNLDFQGTDQFTYTAFDGVDRTAEIPVTIGVETQPFAISEFMASNGDTLETRLRDEPTARFRGERFLFDWIEIQNLLNQPIDMGGLHLTDNPNNLEKWEFPAGTVVEAGGYLLVFASGRDISDPMLDENNALHTNFGLADDGEYIAITAADGTVLHEFDFPRMPVDVSFGSTPDGGRYFLTPTPGVVNEGDTRIGFAAGPSIDQDNGFFTEPVTVTVTSSDPATTIRYTLDGSAPTESSPEYVGPIEVTGTSVVRTRAFLADYLPSRVDTRTFIYLADVIQQSPDGEPLEGWPERWGLNSTDYGMDPDVVNSDEWGPQMEAALTQIPSMSIVTDLDNLFDRQEGIYSRASMDGFAAERPASLELINPDGTVGFQHNIGLRIRGGFSRSASNPKHAFRIFFESPYGDGTLRFPLFDDDGAPTFAKVDLRTTQNYSWAFQGDGRNTFIRDVFSRDLQRALGNESTRGRYYHLYINGMYFGLFQTDERPEANFGASYYGGQAEDYDVIHNDPRANGATNGNMDAYGRLHAFFIQENGLADVNMEDYYRAQGMNPDGSRNPDYERLLDVDNLIDYMIITYYTSDADGPGSKFTRPGLNNYFTIFNRENPDGFKFIEHDSEHSLDTGNAAGANYNMVSPLLGDRQGERLSGFNPHWAHEQLANSNSDYLIRFQDRIAELFAEGGIMDDENLIAMVERREAEFDLAIIAESARWGDAQRQSRPYTKDDWERAVRTLKNWFTSRGRGEGRRAEVLGQLAREGWWDEDLSAPTLDSTGGRVDPGFEVAVTLDGPGVIYVTTDGTDPRSSGGGINPNALIVQSGDRITIDSATTVRVRNFHDGQWSTSAAAQFFVEPLADLNSLRISEIHYHPAAVTPSEQAAGFTDADDFEFMEFVNVSDRTIDLTGARLNQVAVGDRTEGVSFVFSDGNVHQLAPGERAVVVENLAAFQQRYGSDLLVAGQWNGGLSNRGELITLETADGNQLQFAYSDQWYPTTDGTGPSLQHADASAADLALWGQPTGWRPSAAIGGTPGRASQVLGDSNGDGTFDATDLILAFQAGEYEDNVAGNSTYSEGDWNGDGDFDTSDLVFVFQAGTYRGGDIVVAAERARRITHSPLTSHDSVFAVWDELEKKPIELHEDDPWELL